MPYSIDRYNGTTITVVEDGTIDTTLDIKLIGKNYAGYGEVQNENMVHLLEHFAGGNPPPRPVSGQIWYDNATARLKMYNGTKWKATGSAEVATSTPSGLSTGDFWYDSTNDQLYVNNGTGFVLVGPETAPGLGITQFKSRTVLDDQTPSGSHAIIECIVDDETVYVIASDEFTLSSTLNPITGFGRLKKGLTLVNTSETNPSDIKYGVTQSDHRYWGTASNAEQFAGRPVGDFALISNLGDFDDTGYNLGNSDDLQVYIDVDGTTVIFKNSQSSTIKFQTTSGTVRTPLTLVGSDLLPGTTATSNIGSSLLKYATVYANSFDGVATQSSTLFWNSGYRVAAATATSNTIVVRDGSGNVYATQFVGAFSGNASTATLAATATNANSLYEVNDAIYRSASRTNTANTVVVRNNAGDIFASVFQGTATQAQTLAVSGVFRSAATTATADTVVARDNTGAIYASGFYGNATSATTATNAVTATQADSVEIDVNSGVTTSYLTYVTGTDGYLELKVNPSLLYNATTNTLNVNVTGAGAATSAVNVGITNDTASTTAYVTFVTATSGNANVRVNSNMTYNAATNVLTTTATQARYADLAEKYLTDQEYQVGTVVVVGGDAEVTACQPGMKAFGVVSGAPAYLMNSEAEGQAIALKGRVPVKVVGSVNKGSRLVAGEDGCARAIIPSGGYVEVFAIALEENLDEDLKIVEAIIL